MNEPITVVPRVIGAIIAVVLQIALAPNIALFGVVPNFIMAYVLIVSIVCPDQSGPVFAFVLGLLFDLLGTGPVGAMAFLLTGVSFLAKRIFMLVNNDTLFMPLLLAAISTLVIELLYAAFMMAFGRGRERPRCIRLPRAAGHHLQLPCGAYLLPDRRAFPGRSRFSSSLERRIFARGRACW